MLSGVAEYLPDPTGKDEQRLPEKDFFFKVLYSLHPKQVEEWIKLASKERQTKGQNLQEQQWTLQVSQEWIDQLLLHDFESSKIQSLIKNFL